MAKALEVEIGTKMGRLTAIEEAQSYEEDGKKTRRVMCICECGNTKLCSVSHFLSGEVSSCGCFKNGPRIIIPIGTRFASLVTTEENRMYIYNGKARNEVSCVCDCGNYRRCYVPLLNSGKIKSCGCVRNDNKYSTHKMTNSRLYKTWKAMKQRCQNPNSELYERYGKRGIKVSEEWQEFEVFCEWALSNGYNDNLTIDRVDNDKGYSADNCRWATPQQQCYNKKPQLVNKPTSSKYKGVSKVNGKGKVYWIASINADKITYRLGKFDTEIEAALAYNEAAKKYHKEFAHLNQIENEDCNEASD